MGLYDYPKTDPQFGMLQPTADAIANALAGRDGTRLQPSGAYAANLLGLSAQVPTKVVFLTDGRARTVQIGPRQIIPEAYHSPQHGYRREKQWTDNPGIALPGPEER